MLRGKHRVFRQSSEEGKTLGADDVDVEELALEGGIAVEDDDLIAARAAGFERGGGFRARRGAGALSERSSSSPPRTTEGRPGAALVK